MFRDRVDDVVRFFTLGPAEVRPIEAQNGLPTASTTLGETSTLRSATCSELGAACVRSRGAFCHSSSD